MHLRKVKKLEKLEREILHLNANENVTSDAVRRMISSDLSERYFFGGGKRRVLSIGNATFFGLEEVEDFKRRAERTIATRLGAARVNLNCLSGVHAMMSVLLACTNPGDAIMSVREGDGGHFATTGIIARIGRTQAFMSFHPGTMDPDWRKIRKTCRELGVRLVYLDISNHIKPFDIATLRSVAGKKAVIAYDASHSLGLMVGGVFPNPLALGADIISANTHKTFPGPQKGILLFKNKNYGDHMNGVINGCLVSSVHTHHLLALCVAIAEMDEYGATYATKTVENANRLAAEFVRLGYEVRKADARHYTYNHQIHVFPRGRGKPLESYERLVRNNISLNFEKSVFGERIFMRIGVQELTRHGMGGSEMREVASIIGDALAGKNARGRIRHLLARFSRLSFQR